jgi:hypothetical protein
MSIKNRVNFVKGWPNPHIVERVAQPHSGVTTLQAGMIGHLDSTAHDWVLGVSAVTQEPHVFHNDQADPDSGNVSADPTLYTSVLWGGVHGISHMNPLIYDTIQYGVTAPTGSTACGTPAVDDLLFADTDGKLYVGKTGATVKLSGQAIVAVCTQAPFTYQGLSYITVRPDNRGFITP